MIKKLHAILALTILYPLAYLIHVTDVLLGNEIKIIIGDIKTDKNINN